VATFARDFLDLSSRILAEIDDEALEAIALELADTRERGGRLFLCGSGGGAGHASHAACDFRKLAHIESYCVTDNVSELTARVNDDGWDSSYANWLRASQFRAGDCLFVFSVGGGSLADDISTNLVNAMVLAQEVGASIVGVVGRDGGELRRRASACVVIPNLDDRFVTPQTEGMQALMWHLVVSHPSLAAATAKWEGVSERA
jgi:D-sedoheptulose 7-phosphate isomerase